MRSTRIAGLIFDLDGTLLDTLYDLQTAVNMTLTSLGYPTLSYDDVRVRVGKGFKNLMERSIPEKVSDEKLDEAVQIFKSNYSKCYMDKTKAYEGIELLIETLLDEGFQIGINSNKGDQYTKDLINKHFPGIDQNLVYGKREGYPIKPDPANNREIMEKMRLTESQVLYIGDSLVDLETGRNTRLQTVLCAWGFVDKEKLLEANPDYIIDNPAELLDIIFMKNGVTIW